MARPPPRHRDRALDGDLQEARARAGPHLGSRGPGRAVLGLDRLRRAAHRRRRGAPALEPPQEDQQLEQGQPRPGRAAPRRGPHAAQRTGDLGAAPPRARPVHARGRRRAGPPRGVRRAARRLAGGDGVLGDGDPDLPPGLRQLGPQRQAGGHPRPADGPAGRVLRRRRDDPEPALRGGPEVGGPGSRGRPGPRAERTGVRTPRAPRRPSLRARRTRRTSPSSPEPRPRPRGPTRTAPARPG